MDNAKLNRLIRSLLAEMKKKDNLTDVVQVVSQSKPVSNTQSGPKKPQQVVANNGEIITLGTNSPKKS